MVIPGLAFLCFVCVSAVRSYEIKLDKNVAFLVKVSGKQ